MKLFKFIPVVLTIAMAQSMSSCLKTKDNTYSINQSYTNLFNTVVDLNTGDITLYPEQSYKVDWDIIKQTAKIQINGLKLPDGGSYPSLFFNDVPWKFNTKGWYDITLSDYTPSASSSYMNNLVFDRFNFQTINRAISDIPFPPCLSISYTINNTYKVYTMPMEIIEAGENTVTAPDGSSHKSSTLSSNMPIYYLEIDPSTKKAFIVVQNADFYKDMEPCIIKLNPLEFNVNQGGEVTCTGTDIVPYKLKSSEGINGKGERVDDYVITDLKATYISEYGLTITYNCVYKDEVYKTKFVTVYPQTPQSTTQPSITPSTH